jgi:MFS family permease
LIAAIGFALFTLPGMGGSYWTMFFPALVVLGLGMAISVAPLTTTVMNSVDQNHAGTASGVNNAVSRIAALLAVAALGALLTALDRKLNNSGVSAAARAHVEAQRSRLAAAETDDPLARQAIHEAFVDGYRAMLWVAVGLALASSLSAGLLIRAETKRAR